MIVCATDSHPSFLLYAVKICERQIGTCIWYNRLHASSYVQRVLADVFSIINRHEVSSCCIVFVLLVYRTVYDVYATTNDTVKSLRCYQCTI